MRRESCVIQVIIIIIIIVISIISIIPIIGPFWRRRLRRAASRRPRALWGLQGTQPIELRLLAIIYFDAPMENASSNRGHMRRLFSELYENSSAGRLNAMQAGVQTNEVQHKAISPTRFSGTGLNYGRIHIRLYLYIYTYIHTYINTYPSFGLRLMRRLHRTPTAGRNNVARAGRCRAERELPPGNSFLEDFFRAAHSKADFPVSFLAPSFNCAEALVRGLRCGRQVGRRPWLQYGGM